MSQATTSTIAAKLAALLASPAIRLDCYRSVRRAFKGVRALCAATVSEYLIRAGVLSGYRPWTAQLESALKAKGWIYVGNTDSVRAELASARSADKTVEGPPTAAGGDKLRPYGVAVVQQLLLGDICYTVDSNRNGAPDHVFFFIRWLDRSKLVAEVVDNYSPHPHPRNLAAPLWYRGRRLAYGRFDHAQRLLQH